MNIQTPNSSIVVPAFYKAKSLMDALRWVNETLLSKQVPVEASRVWYDRIKKPRSLMVKTLGISVAAEKIAQRIAPGGTWTVEVARNPNGFHQLSVWYSKFALYAYAMTRSEEGFECLGVDFESINAIYRSCMGFVDIGIGDGGDPKAGFERTEADDVDLFSNIYSRSAQLWPPALPFDEAFRPCAVFLAVRNPKLFARQFCRPESGYYRYFEHAKAVLNDIDVPLPDYLKGR